MKIDIGIIGGSGFSKFIENCEYKKVYTPYGLPSDKIEIGVFENRKIAFIPRHGKSHNIPPHKINHKANIYGLKKLNVKKIISITSVGSMKKDITCPSIFIPIDYINFSNIQTYYETEIVHITPELSTYMIDKLFNAGIKCGYKVFKGVYVQTTGPRLETKSEINMLKNFGDVVGMNMATEAGLANELGIEFANISSVDNYANGIVEEKLKFEQILENAKKNSIMIREVLSCMLSEIE